MKFMRLLASCSLFLLMACNSSQSISQSESESSSTQAVNQKIFQMQQNSLFMFEGEDQLSSERCALSVVSYKYIENESIDQLVLDVKVSYDSLDQVIKLYYYNDFVFQTDSQTDLYIRLYLGVAEKIESARSFELSLFRGNEVKRCNHLQFQDL